jgi:hypothetical protein
MPGVDVNFISISSQGAFTAMPMTSNPLHKFESVPGILTLT